MCYVVDSTRHVATLSNQVSEIDLLILHYFCFGNRCVLDPIFLEFFFFFFFALRGPR